MGSMIGSGLITFVVSCVSAALFFFMLMLGLNGYMGQERAVNASFGVFIVSALIVILSAAALSAFAAGSLQRRFSWHAAVAVLVSSASFSVIAAALHFVCVIAAAFVADGMRTGK